MVKIMSVLKVSALYVLLSDISYHLFFNDLIVLSRDGTIVRILRVRNKKQ